MMSAGVIVVIELVAAIVIALQAVMRINRMSRSTRLSYFAAWALMGGSAAAVAAGLLARQSVPDIYSATLLASVALVASLDRRRAL